MHNQVWNNHIKRFLSLTKGYHSFHFIEFVSSIVMESSALHGGTYKHHSFWLIAEWLIADWFSSPDITHCNGITCHNGGTCISHSNGFYCQCNKGFEGKFCKNGKQNKVCIHVIEADFVLYIAIDNSANSTSWDNYWKRLKLHHSAYLAMNWVKYSNTVIQESTLCTIMARSTFYPNLISSNKMSQN